MNDVGAALHIELGSHNTHECILTCDVEGALRIADNVEKGLTFEQNQVTAPTGELCLDPGGRPQRHNRAIFERNLPDFANLREKLRRA